MKVCIAVLLLAVLGGARLIDARRKKSPWHEDSAIQYRATRKLTPNHRIVATDLAVPAGLPGDLYWRLPARSSLEGHYVDVCCEISPGASVETSKVRISPSLLSPEQIRPFIYSLEGKPQLADMLDPGVGASLGDIDVEVSAVICPLGSDPSKPLPCYAVLAVPADKAKDLWKTNPVPPLVPKNF